MSKNNSSFGISKILSIISGEGAGVHFIGVGGVSMSSLFGLSRYFGISVSGSDRRETPILSSLILRGADIVIGERERLPEGVRLVVYSLAVDEGDRELSLALQSDIPCVSRAEYMAALLECYGERIAVSGSHGKSTVTAMIYRIFEEDGRAPTALSGASLGKEEGSFAIGGLQSIVYEACEYKDSFLYMPADIGVFLNLELDHVDYFKNFDEIYDSFGKAIIKCGRPIINTDDENLKRLAALRPDAVRVGSCGDEDYTYRIKSVKPYAISFSISVRGGEKLDIMLPMIGEFNASNAALAAAAAMECKVSPAAVARALSGFSAIGGRLEVIGSLWGAPVYRDYAHHPTEILAGIRAIRGAVGGKVAVIFAPHTYSRTRAFFCDFAKALSEADFAIVTEITAARELNPDVRGIELAEAAGAVFAPDKKSLEKAIPTGCAAYVVMGAGDCDWIVDCIAEHNI